MGDVLLVLAVAAAAVWLAVSLYFGYVAEIDAVTPERPLRRRTGGRRGRHHFA